MKKKIAIAIVGLIALLLIVASTRPDFCIVQRSISIKASPEKILGIVNDLKKWDEWSPYDQDPNKKVSISPNSIGVGASYEWEGNSQIGAGRLDIVDTSPTTSKMRLEMKRPMACLNDVEFSTEADGALTKITWKLKGHSNILAKIMGLFINVDQMVGADFEKGLKNLKHLAEQEIAAK